MKVLLVGGGAREHALAWKLRQDDPGAELLAAPGNPGIAAIARCVPVPATDVDALVALGTAERPDFTVVGPEAPLSLGIVDRFRAAGLAVFGPTKAAAEIETSKTFAKSLMLAAGVPTARAERHTDPRAARRALRNFGLPVVVKASGLAAGKGVIVCETSADALAAVDYILRGGFGDAGAEILVEEFMVGEELSVFALTDGERFELMPAAQDHKRLLDGDRGPNTGGMGAYAPSALAGQRGPGGRHPMDDAAAIVDRTLWALRDAGRPFTGLLYAGLMVTDQGSKVVEFNCRFGDPEAEAVLPLMESTLLSRLEAVACGGRLLDEPARWRDAAAVTTVLAAANYPDRPRTGDPITLPDAHADVCVFHAGTALDASGTLVTAGGRVLAVTAVAGTVEEARRLSADHAARVQFDGKQFRSDIAWREVDRRARAT
jgi:phosphoribosylamine---glycine ligase